MWEQFLQQRVYLKGIAKETQRYYRWVRVAFDPILAEPTKAGALACIQKLREKGVKPISVNSYLCGFNAYCMWLHKEHSKKLVKIPRRKEEQKILATFGTEQISRLIHWKPIGRNQARAHVIALVALDAGLRISDLLGLTRQNVDLDNLVLRVNGKGNKQRLVPISIELRKSLYRYMAKHNHARIFCTRSGTALTVRNAERDFLRSCAGRPIFWG